MIAPARTAYAALAPALLALLWHHVAVRCAGAYLLGDVAAPRAPLAALHAASFVAGVAVARRFARRAGAAEASLSAFALVAGAASGLAPIAFARADLFRALAFASSPLIGLGAGLTAALLAAELARERGLAGAFVGALRAESAGAALASVTLWALVSHRLGLARSGLVLASLAALVAHVGLHAARAPGVPRAPITGPVAALVVWSAGAAAVCVEYVVPFGDVTRLPDPVVLALDAPSGHALLTAGRGAFQLYVDGALRLSTLDGYRRREALARPAMAAAARRDEVLVVGADGGALGAVLAADPVARATLVDPDPARVALARSQPIIASENGHALDSPRVRIVIDDPLLYFEAHPLERFDVVILDPGEPDLPARSKLYTSYFFGLVRAHMNEGATGAVPTASPALAPRAHRCVLRTLADAGFDVRPYAVGLPSSGEAGFALFARDALTPPPPESGAPRASFADAATQATFFDLAPSHDDVVEVNRLYRQVLLRYRDEGAP